MTSIFARVNDALETLSPAVPYALDRFLTANGADLPDTYITFYMMSGEGVQHADNDETLRQYDVQITIFSRSGLAALPDVDTAMLSAGFIKGPERQLPTDEQTRHFGLAKDYSYFEDL
jgi:hypothetical protein